MRDRESVTVFVYMVSAAAAVSSAVGVRYASTAGRKASARTVAMYPSAASMAVRKTNAATAVTRPRSASMVDKGANARIAAEVASASMGTARTVAESAKVLPFVNNMARLPTSVVFATGRVPVAAGARRRRKMMRPQRLRPQRLALVLAPVTLLVLTSTLLSPPSSHNHHTLYSPSPGAVSPSLLLVCQHQGVGTAQHYERMSQPV